MRELFSIDEKDPKAHSRVCQVFMWQCIVMRLLSTEYMGSIIHYCLRAQYLSIGILDDFIRLAPSVLDVRCIGNG